MAHQTGNFGPAGWSVYGPQLAGTARPAYGYTRDLGPNGPWCHTRAVNSSTKFRSIDTTWNCLYIVTVGANFYNCNAFDTPAIRIAEWDEDVAEYQATVAAHPFNKPTFLLLHFPWSLRRRQEFDVLAPPGRTLPPEIIVRQINVWGNAATPTMPQTLNFTQLNEAMMFIRNQNGRPWDLVFHQFDPRGVVFSDDETDSVEIYRATSPISGGFTVEFMIERWNTTFGPPAGSFDAGIPAGQVSTTILRNHLTLPSEPVRWLRSFARDMGDVVPPVVDRY